jgi:hypothetical protein
MSERLPYDDQLEIMFEEWAKMEDELSHTDPISEEDKDTARISELVKNDLNQFNHMTVEEYTLWQKWEQINRVYPSTTSLFGDSEPVNKEQAMAIQRVKSKIWVPETPESYQALEPELVYTHEETENWNPLANDWTTMRHFIHTQMHAGVIGRAMNFLVRDKVTGGYLGVITISGDFLDMTARDEKIGWTREQRTAEQRIQYTAIGSTIVPTQPLGFNYVGGKLLALLCLSDTVANKWEELYGKKLIGLSTTSLYGKNKRGHGMSQYDNLKYWKKMGYSKGSVSYQLSRPVRKQMRQWLRWHHPRKYWEWLIASDKDGKPLKRDATNRSNQYAYRKLGISGKMFSSAHERGIYFCRLYENSDAFLKDEITESDLRPRFDNTEDALAEIWKSKYASRRISSLQKNDRVSSGTLFYNDLMGVPWEEAKDKYLSQVGR